MEKQTLSPGMREWITRRTFDTIKEMTGVEPKSVTMYSKVINIAIVGEEPFERVHAYLAKAGNIAYDGIEEDFLDGYLHHFCVLDYPNDLPIGEYISMESTGG